MGNAFTDVADKVRAQVEAAWQMYQAKGMSREEFERLPDFIRANEMIGGLSKMGGGFLNKATNVVTSAVKTAGRAVDITSSKGLLAKVPVVGSTAVKLARQGVATAKIATGVTAFEAIGAAGAKAVGADKLGNWLGEQTERDVKEGAKGYATGAAAGAAIAGGAGLSEVGLGFLKPPVPAGGFPDSPGPDIAEFSRLDQITPEGDLTPLIVIGAAVVVLILVS